MFKFVGDIFFMNAVDMADLAVDLAFLAYRLFKSILLSSNEIALNSNDIQ